MGSYQNENPSKLFIDTRSNIIQEIFHAPLAPISVLRGRLARAQRNTQRMLWIPHRDLNSCQQSITSWVIVAHHETRCTRAGEQMHEMPKARHPHTPTCRTPQCHAITVSFLTMGDGHSRIVSTYDWAKKIPLVAIDYFTKWVDTEPLAHITEGEVMLFIRKNIICRFGVPREIISDNGRQFQGRRIQD
ncbi:hypothetical protein Sango_2322100 [Sesamum angolense]|uniref:Integrase catalytic domain-containing protein n=1 Tax=Sesamum angolense TaxID=2727404 RepID=A0AAE1WB17_9LAMI|nr:hypothetical protein Sango_2322100 [Sesamum angolense]